MPINEQAVSNNQDRDAKLFMPRWIPTRASAFRIAFWYAILGALWILCSGWVLHHFVLDHAREALLENLKGWFFVSVTALGLGVVLDRYFQRIRRSASELHASETKLQLVGDNLPDSYVYQYTRGVDGKPQFTYLSAGAERIHGVKVAEILQDANRLFAQIEPAQQPALAEAEAESARNLTEFSMELQMRHPDGDVRFLQVRSRPHGNPRGSIHWDGFATDITRQKLADQSLQISEQNYREIFNAGDDAISLHDTVTGRVLDVNAALLRMSGYSSKEELIDGGFAKGFVENSPYNWEEAGRRIRRAVEEGPQVFEWLNRRKDGSVFWVEISLRCAKVGGKACVLAIARDISQRKAQEREIQRLTRLYLTLSQVNQSIVQCQTREELLQSICEAMVNFGKFTVARIDAMAGNGNEMKLVAHFSLKGGSGKWASDWDGMCAICKEAACANGPSFCNEANKDPRTVCCRDALREFSIASCGAFPLQLCGQTVATLALCSSEPNFFRAEENRVLEEIASDISYALDRLDEQERRQAAEAGLRASETLLRMMGRTAKVGGWEFDAATGEGTWTEEIASIHDLDPAVKPNKEMGLSHFQGDSRTRIEAALQDAIQRGTPYDLELELVSAKAAHKWVRTICQPEVVDGKVVKLRGSMQDITDRKRAEAVRERQQRRLVLLADVSRQLVITDASVNLLDSIFKQLAQELEVDIFANYMVAPAGNRLLLQSSVGLTEQQGRDFAELAFGESLCGLVAQSRQSHVYADLPSVSEPQAKGIAALGVRAYAGFPLLAHDRLTGTISFGSRRRECYDEDDVRLMKAVADQVAAAVERNRLLDAVRLSEMHLRTYIDQAADAIFVHDETGRFLEVNNTACANLGYSREELLKLGVLDVTAGYDAAKAQALWKGTSPGDQLTLSDHNRRKDGTIFPVELRYGCFDMDGKRYFLGLVRDVTQRQLAEDEIRRQSGLIRSLLDSIPDLVFFKSVRGVYLGCNPAFADFVGRKREEIVGKSDHDLFPESVAESFREHDRKMLEALTPFRNEEWVTYPDGRRVLLDTLKTPYRGPDGSLLGVLGISRDLTARKESEDKLRESEQRFRALVEAAPDAIFVRTGECFAYVNNAAATLFGTSSVEDLLGQRVLDRFRTDCRKEAAERMNRMAATNESTVEVDRVLLKLDGTEVEACVSAVPITFQGKPSALVYARDVSDRKRAEKALWQHFELQNRLAKIAATVPGVIYSFMLRPDGSMAMPYASAAIEGVFGINPEEAREDAAPIFARIHPEDVNRVKASITNSARTLKPWREEFRINDGRRGVVWVEGHSVPQLEADGALLWHGFFHDITERRHAEEQVRQLSRAVNQSPVSVVITDVQGRIEYVNPKFTELTGYTLEEARGKNPRILKSDNTSNEEYRQLWNTIKRGDTWRGEFLNRKKNGEKFWEIATISPVFDESGNVTHFLAVKEDITARKQLEAQLLQSQKLEAIGQLAGGVAHDFNNILAAMMMQSELSAMVKGVPEEVREGLQQIRAATERAASLTRQLLLFSRKQVLQSRILDLNEVVTSLAKMLQRIIREDVRLQLHLHPAPLMTQADAGMLDQVLMNLAVNARDAMPGGGNLLVETSARTIDAEAALAHPDAVPGRYVCLSVTDSGCGMTPEVQSRIFEPFFTTKEPGKGTGLGLATVFGIVKQHRGWITVKSEAGKGTIFHVHLPANEGKVAVETKGEDLMLQGGTETILLVEDDNSLRRMTRTLLERQGYTVIEAVNGVEAVRLWNQHKDAIDLLLTDLVMPAGMTGQQLAHNLRASRSDLRVVFTSGYSAELSGTEVHLRAGENFLQKPSPPALLLQTIRDTLER